MTSTMRASVSVWVLVVGFMTVPRPIWADPVGEAFETMIDFMARDVVRLARQMPADRYDFAPSDGTFDGVRTFGLQVRHLATALHAFAASILDEELRVDRGASMNGADTLRTKEEILAYLDEAIAYARTAARTVTSDNIGDLVRNPLGGSGTMQRGMLAAALSAHSYDHYGQMVVYARMNGVVPGG